jgi:hypothetical protein
MLVIGPNLRMRCPTMRVTSAKWLAAGNSMSGFWFDGNTNDICFTVEFVCKHGKLNFDLVFLDPGGWKLCKPKCNQSDRIKWHDSVLISCKTPSLVTIFTLANVSRLGVANGKRWRQLWCRDGRLVRFSVVTPVCHSRVNWSPLRCRLFLCLVSGVLERA